MNFDEPNDDGLYQVLLQDYTNEEVKVFVQCIMSGNIGPEDIMRCLTAIGCNMCLDHDLYEASETDEEGQLTEYVTSQFQEFVNEGVEMLMYQSDPEAWIRFLLKELLKDENYELLHTLQIEKTWNI